MKVEPWTHERRAHFAHTLVGVFSPGAKPDDVLDLAARKEIANRINNSFQVDVDVDFATTLQTEQEFHEYIMTLHVRELDVWEAGRDLLKEITDGVDEFLADPSTARTRVVEVSPAVHAARMAAFKATCIDSALTEDEDEDETPVKAGRTFSLSASETAKARAWEREQTTKADKPATIGGRFQYRITPTSVGLVVKIYDTLLQEEIEVTEYENW